MTAAAAEKWLRGSGAGGLLKAHMAKWSPKTISFYDENFRTFERIIRLGFSKFNFHRAPGTSFLTRCCVRLFDDPAGHIEKATEGRVQLTPQEVEALYYHLMMLEADADGRTRDAAREG